MFLENSKPHWKFSFEVEKNCVENSTDPKHRTQQDEKLDLGNAGLYKHLLGKLMTTHE